MIKTFHNKQIIDSEKLKDPSTNFLFLSPTKESESELLSLEKNINEKIYLSGWRFRNAVGLNKFRLEIQELLKPVNHEEITSFVNSIRKEDINLVGVHIRHGDYKTWQDGKYFFSFLQVRAILDDYLAKNIDVNNKTLFLICSDDAIDENVFNGLNYIKGIGSEISDLFSLTKMDLIIGSQSTYGTFAAYYGNIPFFTFSRGAMDWQKSSDIFLI